MSLTNLVSVRSSYTRSINIEKHKSSLDSVIGYLPTSRAVNTLERVAGTLNSNEVPRSWSLVGPYGSGKSAFAVFLSALLSNPESELFKNANTNLMQVDSKLAKQFSKDVEETQGYIRVLISGSAEPLSRRIIKSLHQSCEEIWDSVPGKKPIVFQKMAEAINESAISASSIVSLINEVQDAVANSKAVKSKGILLIIDELGKFLEYAARHTESNDLFVLQAIAEHALQPHDVRLLQFVMLHKSFEHYAQGLTEHAKNQWAAVQGRFEEVPFIENSEQVLQVVSKAIEHAPEITSNLNLKALVCEFTKSIIAESAVSSTLKEQAANKLFFDCYPLHPISALLLPLLCQQVAQNERTLFSYLGSSEMFGFQNMLEGLDESKGFIYPADIYDYFISNQAAALGDMQTSRRWAEVVTAVERLGDVSSKVTIDVLKTIGILNIVGARGGFKPSYAILNTCFEESALKLAIDELNTKSIVTLRKFNNEYRVWQGSDFDLHAAVLDEIEKSKGSSYSLAQNLASSNPMPPVVARKYTIQTGNLRYFAPEYADQTTLKNKELHSDDSKIIFYLRSEGEPAFGELDFVEVDKRSIFCVVSNSDQLASITREINAYRIVATRQEVHADPVVKKELEVNLSVLLATQKVLLNELISLPQKSKWYYCGKEQAISSKRDIQRLLSTAMEDKFGSTPKVFNELINKDKPSSQAASGRAKLMKAMLAKSDCENLGIEKFPPEKAMYMAIFKELKIHIKAGNQYEFQAPPGGSYVHVWSEISKFLDSTEDAAKSFSELDCILTSAPYGVKRGLLPIFYLHAYLVYQDDVALFEDGKYQPSMTEEHVERFIKKPDSFKFQLYKLEGLNGSLLTAYSKALYQGSKQDKKVLQIAQPLVKFFTELPEFTQSTREANLLSGESIAIREAIKMSKSPEKLIFVDLPKAMDVEKYTDKDSVDAAVFGEALIKSLRELKEVYSNLLKHLALMLSEQLIDGRHHTISELRKVLLGQGLTVHKLAAGPARTFINSLIDEKSEQDELWLENVFVSLSRKHPSKWKDQDLAKAEATLADLSRRFRELQSIVQDDNYKAISKNDSDFEVIMLRSIKQSSEPKQSVVTINKNERKLIDDEVSKVRESLYGLKGQIRMAVLAQLVELELPEVKDYEQ
ncbi:hypothetical protein DSB67_04270 [Vibrio campbellii]|uniref:hypothetical protein n=1 Tax=Vibrio campbellii TaxID=680 RepID=UPI00026C4DBD|nr:hypothetical protein [Vibrio campbellii]AXB30833.1 hypothetical protein DSB67_04270 [Vibrio campbellii]